jgi:hypothetical protein
VTSLIDPATVQAYRETHFRVLGDASIVLQIGTANDALAALHHAFSVASSAFITACNPFSRVCGDRDNAARQAALSRDLKQLGVGHLDGVGEHPSGNWPPEPSFLVLGVSLDDACAVGRRHEQNAIVWSGRDAVPHLILLR